MTIDPAERQARDSLRAIIETDFEWHEEVNVRHATFRRRRLRVDVLAIPRDERFSDIAIAFETKSERVWDDPQWAACLKQASDYVLASVEPDLPKHAGKRIMATFVYPTPAFALHVANGQQADPDALIMSGMAQMALYFRVGMARPKEFGYDRRRLLALTMGPNQIWVHSRGWTATARNVLVGKRQIGSQRFPILEELAAMDGKP